MKICTLNYETQNPSLHSAPRRLTVSCPCKRLENSSLDKLSEVIISVPVQSLHSKTTKIQACRASNHLLCNSLLIMSGQSRITTFKDQLQHESQRLKHKQEKEKKKPNSEKIVNAGYRI